jgi:hypothetical protein
MLALFVVLFLASLPVLLYHKYCTCLDVWEKPRLYNESSLFVLFSGVRLLVGWGSIAGISYYAGRLGAVAAVSYFLLGTIALRLYYHRQVRQWLPVFVKTLSEEHHLSPGEQPGREILREAQRMSRSAVDKAMRGEKP